MEVIYRFIRLIKGKCNTTILLLKIKTYDYSIYKASYDNINIKEIPLSAHKTIIIRLIFLMEDYKASALLRQLLLNL